MVLFHVTGRVIPESTVRVVDPETKRDLPDGQQGLLLARGPGVTAGYFDDEGATNAAFAAGAGWFDSGDLGWRCPEVLIWHVCSAESAKSHASESHASEEAFAAGAGWSDTGDLGSHCPEVLICRRFVGFGVSNSGNTFAHPLRCLLRQPAGVFALLHIWAECQFQSAACARSSTLTAATGHPSRTFSKYRRPTAAKACADSTRPAVSC